MQVASRPPQFEDNLYHIMNKGFSDASPSSNGALSGQPDPLLTSRIQQQTAATDVYGRHTQLGTNTLLDPSEFPSLGGGNNNPAPASSPSNSALLSSSNGFDSLAANFKAALPTVMNGLNPYSDMYSLSAYANTRSKAVDALTGTGASTEFSMQSEDFPVLGGGATEGNAGRSSNSTNAAQSSTIENGAPSLVPGLDRINAANNDAYFNVTTQSAGLGQYTGGATSIMGQTGLGSSVASLQVPLTSTMGQYSLSKPNPLNQTYSRQDRLSATATHIGQQSNDGLTHLTRGQGVDRLTPSTPTGQGILDTTSVQVQSNPYLNPSSMYGSRGRSVMPPYPASNPSNFDGNTAVREPVSKMSGDTVNPLDNQEASRRSRMRAQLLSTSASPSIPLVPEENATVSSRVRLSENSDPIPAVLPSEKFGMKGLLGTLNPPSGSPPDVSLLSLGLDLTQLGLNLNSNEPLHKTFDSPWDGAHKKLDGTSQEEEPSFKLPACYYMSPPPLKVSHFSKFQLETLFYIFYNMPRDVLQQLAAVELHSREWRYHKDLKLWFTRAPGTEGAYDRGAYIYFDIKSWERRPFHDANLSFVNGLMHEEELRSFQIPAHMSSGA